MQIKDLFEDVRTAEINGETWFIAKDICDDLGYTNNKDAVRKHVWDKNKTVIQRSQIATLEIPNRGMTIINESGVYQLIFASKMPKAQEFQAWVFDEVLPMIRRTGEYHTDANLEMWRQHHDDPVFVLGQLEKYVHELKEAKITIAQQGEQIAELEPDAEYTREVLTSESTFTTTAIASQYDMTAYELNQFLNEKGVIKKVGKVWMLRKAYMNQGLAVINTTYIDDYNITSKQIRWTEKGSHFIYELLAEED